MKHVVEGLEFGRPASLLESTISNNIDKSNITVII